MEKGKSRSILVEINFETGRITRRPEKDCPQYFIDQVHDMVEHACQDPSDQQQVTLADAIDICDREDLWLPRHGISVKNDPIVVAKALKFMDWGWVKDEKHPDLPSRITTIGAEWWAVRHTLVMFDRFDNDDDAAAYERAEASEFVRNRIICARMRWSVGFYADPYTLSPRRRPQDDKGPK